MRTTINLYYVNLQQKFPDKKPGCFIAYINFTNSVKADGGGAGRSCPPTRWWAWRVTPCRATAARPGWGGVAAATTPPTYCRSFQPTSRSAPVTTSASKSSIRRFVITQKAPTRAFSWLKAATTAFTLKTLLRHYAKRALPHGLST